jgi:hypothetical protein
MVAQSPRASPVNLYCDGLVQFKFYMDNLCYIMDMKNTWKRSSIMITHKNGWLSGRGSLILITFLYGILNGVELFAALPNCSANIMRGGSCVIESNPDCILSTGHVCHKCKCEYDPNPYIVGPASGKWNCDNSCFS